MSFDATLEESQTMTGPLGAVAFVTLKALVAGGASDEALTKTTELINEAFGSLSDADCNVLAEVAHHRLVDRPEDGRWY